MARFFTRLTIVFAAFWWAGQMVCAGQPAPAPQVESLGQGRFRLGLIEFDSNTRAIRLPCRVNLKTDVLEYVLVHAQGKTHESLLATEVSPLQLQTVLKLLSYAQGKGDLLDAFLAPGEQASPQPAGESVELLIEWDNAPPRPVNSVIRDRTADAPLENGPWVTTGSEVIDGKFQAEVEGSIIALYRDPLAIFNSPHPRMRDDENWFPIATELPEVDHPVVLTIRPLDRAQTKLQSK